MEAVVLPKRLFVKTRECGNSFMNQSKQIVDKNTCFWNCLYFFLVQKKSLKEINIAKLKYDTTLNLPFQNILIGNQDPSKKGQMADHRVLQKSVEIFGINIYLLTSGTHIYRFLFNEYKDEPSDTMFLFLHKNHFTIVEEDVYIQRMISASINPLTVLDFNPVSSSCRRKRGKKKGNTFRNVLVHGDTSKVVSLFEATLNETPIPKTLIFEKKQRKRGKRR